MLPAHAYSDPLGLFAAMRTDAADARPALVVAVAGADIERFPTTAFARFAARDTADAIRLMGRCRPRVVAVDWPQIAAAARRLTGTGILITMASPERAPSALKAGCHAVLLKPLTTNLVAARLGRLSREMPTTAVTSRVAEKLGQFGTNRRWPDITCPTCAHPGAVTFEYSSHRREWYACLSCESVWLGRRQD